MQFGAKFSRRRANPSKAMSVPAGLYFRSFEISPWSEGVQRRRAVTHALAAVRAARHRRCLVSCALGRGTSPGQNGGDRLGRHTDRSLPAREHTIDVGDTVRFEFDAATTTHTVTSTSANWTIDETRDPNGAPISRTFDTAGVYTFVCKIHTGMTGSITVEAAARTRSTRSSSSPRRSASATTRSRRASR